MTWSPGRRRGGPPEIKWGKEAERVTQQRNLMSEDAAKRQLKWLKTGGSREKRCIGRQADEVQMDTSFRATLN